MKVSKEGCCLSIRKPFFCEVYKGWKSLSKENLRALLH